MDKQIAKQIKTVAIRAAESAGKFLIKEFNNFDRRQVKLKSHYEILTKSDLGSERIIIREINKDFSDHNILTEESGDFAKQSDFLWIIDPIDGSTNFSFHNPIWSISIAVAYKQEIIFGLVYVPMLKEMYVAEKNKGAFCNGKRIRVSEIDNGAAVHTFCHGGNKESIRFALNYYRLQKMSRLDCRQLGSAAIEMAYVASGRTESIMIPGVRVWDIAAGVLLVKEAGGRVTDFADKPWNLEPRDLSYEENLTYNRQVLATNGLVHKQIIKLLKNC